MDKYLAKRGVDITASNGNGSADGQHEELEPTSAELQVTAETVATLPADLSSSSNGNQYSNGNGSGSENGNRDHPLHS